MALIGLTAIEIPLMRTLTVAKKPVPISVTICARLLATSVAGALVIRVGAAGATVTVLEFDVPATVVTLNASVPGVVKNVSERTTRAVVDVVEFTLTVCMPAEPATTSDIGNEKLLPDIVNNLAPLSARTVSGETLVSVGRLVASGVTLLDAAEAGLRPLALLALTVKV